MIQSSILCPSRQPTNQPNNQANPTDRSKPNHFSPPEAYLTHSPARPSQPKPLLPLAPVLSFPCQVDRAEEVPPPVMVVVMGPRGSGKTTLIRSLIKLYTGELNARTCCVTRENTRTCLFRVMRANTVSRYCTGWWEVDAVRGG